MTIVQLANALVEGKLLPEMLFSKVGSTFWQPLTFVAPIQQSQPEIDIELVKGYYRSIGSAAFVRHFTQHRGCSNGERPRWPDRHTGWAVLFFAWSLRRGVRLGQYFLHQQSFLVESDREKALTEYQQTTPGVSTVG